MNQKTWSDLTVPLLLRHSINGFHSHAFYLSKLIQADALKNRQDLVMYNLDINRSSDAKQFEDLLDLQKFEFIEK
jgi:hypothetical protein